MKGGVFGMSCLALLLLTSPALAINLRVREVRRVRVDQAVTVVYEVENASVDRVRFHRVEAHVFNPAGHRVELLRPFFDPNPMRPGDVTFFQLRLGPETLSEAAELRLRFLVSKDLNFPILEPHQLERLEFRFLFREEDNRVRRRGGVRNPDRPRGPEGGG